MGNLYTKTFYEGFGHLETLGFLEYGAPRSNFPWVSRKDCVTRKEMLVSNLTETLKTKAISKQ